MNEKEEIKNIVKEFDLKEVLIIFLYWKDEPRYAYTKRSKKDYGTELVLRIPTYLFFTLFNRYNPKTLYMRSYEGWDDTAGHCPQWYFFYTPTGLCIETREFPLDFYGEEYLEEIGVDLNEISIVHVK